MKIRKIETFADKMLCFVRVTDEDGAQGTGMTAPFAANITAEVVHEIAAGVAMREYADFRETGDSIIREQYKFLGSFLARAAAGIDTALWDLEAKKAGVPVCVLAGKKRDSIDLYASSMKRDLPVAEEASRLRVLQDKYGYRAIKLHPAIPVGNNKDFWPHRTEDMIVEMMKRAVSGTAVIVDVNGNYSVDRAIEAGRFMKDNGIVLFEEPCPYWDIDATREVRDACEKFGLEVAGGEQDYIDTQWNRIIGGRAVDVCQPDLLYCGGFTRALRFAAQAAAAGLRVTPHTLNRSPIFVMGLHYMSCVENPYPFLECGIETDEWAEASYFPNVKIENGAARAPEAAGWGFDPSPEFMEKSIYRMSEAKK